MHILDFLKSVLKLSLYSSPHVIQWSYVLGQFYLMVHRRRGIGDIADAAGPEIRM